MRALSERQKHQSWCMKNGIKIYPQVTMRGYKIVVVKRINGKWIPEIGKIIFPKNPTKKQPKWWEKIWELYSHYYHKYKPKEVENDV